MVPPIKDIQFNLWAVLMGMLLLGASVCGILYADQKEVRVKQQEVIQRVVRLEAALGYIAEGIKDLKEGQKDVAKQLEETKKVLQAKANRQ